MDTYSLFFATTQHGRKCIKVTGTSTPLTREEIILMAKKLIDEDKTLPAKGKLRRFLRVERQAKGTVRLM